MKTMFLVVFGFLFATSAFSKPTGQFSFGIGLDETWKKYDFPSGYKYDNNSVGVSQGFQLTFGGFYRQDWWMIGVAAGAGTEHYHNFDIRSGDGSSSFVTEITAAASKAIAGRTLFVTGGIIPSIHFQVEGIPTKQPFAVNPYVGLIVAPARHFAFEARVAYDPFFRQSRIGMSFRF